MCGGKGLGKCLECSFFYFCKGELIGFWIDLSNFMFFFILRYGERGKRGGEERGLRRKREECGEMREEKIEVDIIWMYFCVNW